MTRHLPLEASCSSLHSCSFGHNLACSSFKAVKSLQLKKNVLKKKG